MMTTPDPSASALVFAGFLLIAALVCSLATPFYLHAIKRVEARIRSRLLLAWCCAPILLAAIATGLAFSSPVGPFFDAAPEHCATEPGFITAACLLHTGTISLSPLAWVPPFLLGLLALGHLARSAYRFCSARAASRTLFLMSRPGPEDDVRIVEGDRPLAVAGVSPHAFIYVSDSIWRSLDPAARTILVTHERAHLKRLDSWRLGAAEMLTFVYPRSTQGRVLSALVLACEQVCDKEAARTAGPWLTAATILNVERLCGAASSRLATHLASFSESHVRMRVLSLLQASDTESKGMNWSIWLFVLGLIGAFPLSAEGFHLSAEVLLYVFLH